jgi:hypothetical protein
VPRPPEQLRHRGRDRLPVGQRAQRLVAHRPQLDPGIDEARCDLRVLDRPGPPRRRDHRRQLAAEADLLGERGDAALEAERPHRHLPALAGLADDVRGVGGRVLEEDLAELGGAGDLNDRPDLDPRLFHRHQQVGEAAVALRAGLRAGHGEAPVGVFGERGPDLLAVDPPGIAVEPRPGADRGEVGAGAWLRVALAPELFAAQDRRQEALALGVGAEGDEGRRQ